MRSIVSATLVAFCLSGGTAAGLGCADCSVTGQAPIVYEQGQTNESRTIYQTMGPMEEMLYFPQGRTYDLYHGLGSTPVTVDIYLSFIRQLTENGDTDSKTSPNNIAPSAGSQAVIEVWNEEFIRVRNDTCAEFYLRIVALSDPDAAGGSEGAGGIGAGGTGGS